MIYLAIVLPGREPLDLSEHIEDFDWYPAEIAATTSTQAVIELRNDSAALLAILPLKRFRGEFRLIYGAKGKEPGYSKREANFVKMGSGTFTIELQQTGPETTGVF
jgi:hypothetical protein